jgi:hypothetical protein
LNQQQQQQQEKKKLDPPTTTTTTTKMGVKTHRDSSDRESQNMITQKPAAEAK